MKINPYTGEPLPVNQYMPTMPVNPVKLEKIDINAPILENGVDIPTPNSVGAKPKMDIGANALASAGDIMNFGAEQYANFQSVSSSTAESKAQTMGSTLKGASLGMKVGGPWGAAIGGALGLGAGIIDSNKDKKIRLEKENKEYEDMLASTKDERKRSYYLMQGRQVSQAQSNVYGKQQKTYNPNYG
tara:strand:- start:43950 stop:44510 length:561 start_codon:yes stop_codon:yes gene_type:complete